MNNNMDKEKGIITGTVITIVAIFLISYYIGFDLIGFLKGEEMGQVFDHLKVIWSEYIVGALAQLWGAFLYIMDTVLPDLSKGEV